ncbi:MAG: hypothetical protein SVO01_09815 [Thermotogota bacterium]|nr:hypothetical protein [Thermotogota bacterium]
MSEKIVDDRVVVYMRVSPGINDDLEDIKEKYGMSKTAIASLCVGIGLTYLKALTNPEALISSKKLAEVLSESEKMGVKFEKSD